MNYILWRSGKEEGPYTAEDLRQAVANGSVSGNTLARLEVGGDWRPLHGVFPRQSVPPAASSRSSATAEKPIISVTADAAAVMKRYMDAFGVSDSVVSIGGRLKVLGFLIGGLIVVGGFLAADRSGFVAAVGTAVGVAAMLQFYILGSVVAALGQINRACLDSAVNSSPFLDDDLKCRTLQLGTRMKAQIDVSR